MTAAAVNVPEAKPAEPDAGEVEIAAVHYRARVGADGRITLPTPHLSPGQDVVVEVRASRSGGRSGLAILESLGDRRLFKSAAEIDAFLERERASWDR